MASSGPNGFHLHNNSDPDPNESPEIPVRGTPEPLPRENVAAPLLTPGVFFPNTTLSGANGHAPPPIIDDLKEFAQVIGRTIDQKISKIKEKHQELVLKAEVRRANESLNQEDDGFVAWIEEFGLDVDENGERSSLIRDRLVSNGCHSIDDVRSAAQNWDAFCAQIDLPRFEQNKFESAVKSLGALQQIMGRLPTEKIAFKAIQSQMKKLRGAQRGVNRRLEDIETEYTQLIGDIDNHLRALRQRLITDVTEIKLRKLSNLRAQNDALTGLMAESRQTHEYLCKVIEQHRSSKELALRNEKFQDLMHCLIQNSQRVYGRNNIKNMNGKRTKDIETWGKLACTCCERQRLTFDEVGIHCSYKFHPRKAERIGNEEVRIFWEKLIDEWNPTDLRMVKRARHAAHKYGIPSDQRADVWYAVSGAAKLAVENPNRYESLSTTASENDDQIKRDLNRTFRHDTSMPVMSDEIEEIKLDFDGPDDENDDDNDFTFIKPVDDDDVQDHDREESLFRILRAYSSFDPAVGYVQGMNYVAAFLIELFGDEERAFWVFAAVIRNVRALFVEGIPGYHIASENFEKLISYHLPKLSAHFESIGLKSQVICASWFYSLFCYHAIDVNVTLRIWDVFVLEDFSVIMRVSFAILGTNTRELLKMDFPATIDFLKKLRCVDDPNELVECALTLRLRQANLNPVRSFYQHPRPINRA